MPSSVADDGDDDDDNTEELKVQAGPGAAALQGGKPIKLFGAMASHRTQVVWRRDEDG